MFADFVDIEYNAIREAAVLIDVSPLYKYEVEGPDAAALLDRVVTRDISTVAIDQVIYTPWCDEEGKVIDDGTITRLAGDRFRVTAADPSYRWFALNASGLDVRIRTTPSGRPGSRCRDGSRGRCSRRRPGRPGRTCGTSAAARRRSPGPTST